MRNGFMKILTLLCVACLLLPLFAACKSTPADEASQEEEMDTGKYLWTYDQPFTDEHDADMVIDGVLDEARWQNQHCLTFTQDGVTLQYTTVFTEYGVYIGAKSTGDRLMWKGRFNFAGFWQDTSLNTAFGFKIQGKDVTAEHATTVFNFFIDAKNAASRNQTHFEAASTTDGDVDKGTATSMTAELFVSWKALNIKTTASKPYPDYVRIFPAYRRVTSSSVSGGNKWLYPLFAEYGPNRLLCRCRFNKDGYVNYEREDSVLGNAANGIAMSDGWDLSRLTGGKVSFVTSDTYHNQAIFFKGVKSSAYVYTTHVKFTDESWNLNGHAGVCDMIDGSRFNAFYITGSSVRSGTTALTYCTLNFYDNGNGSTWNNKEEGTYIVPADKNPYRDGIDITVIKKNGTFYYFIYDDLVLTKTIDWLSGKSCPGLYTMSRKATFSNYSVENYAGKSAALETLINQKTRK